MKILETLTHQGKLRTIIIKIRHQQLFRNGNPTPCDTSNETSYKMHYFGESDLKSTQRFEDSSIVK